MNQDTIDSLKRGWPHGTLLILHHIRKSRYAVARRCRNVNVSEHPKKERSASRSLEAGVGVYVN